MDNQRLNVAISQPFDSQETIHPFHAFGTLEDVKMLEIQSRNHIPAVWTWSSTNNTE